jgi:hypothetical protein
LDIFLPGFGRQFRISQPGFGGPDLGKLLISYDARAVIGAGDT